VKLSNYIFFDCFIKVFSIVNLIIMNMMQIYEKVPWKILPQGIAKYKEDCGNSYSYQDRIQGHKPSQKIFEKELFGLKWKQFICTETHHAVLIVEETLWDSDGYDENKSAEELAEEGWNAILSRGMLNLLEMHKELKEYIDNTENFKQYIQFCPTDSGITFQSLDGTNKIEFLDFLARLSNKAKKSTIN